MTRAKPSILVVDDDVQVLSMVRDILKLEDYRVITANCGGDAVNAFELQIPDLVVLDILLPDINGYTVCQRIRSSSHVPIIMLTGIGSNEEKVKGLNAGADDYVVKPFSLEELLARIKAVLRRSQLVSLSPPSDVFKNGNLEIDYTRRWVIVDGKEIKLTPTEFHLLQELTINVGKVLTHTYLLNKIWGLEYKDERQYLHVFVGYLRTKIGLKRKGHGSIESIAGVGYRFMV
jgi:two-component system KDP operon response regulator KdpE